jgi:hypothetical protein
VTGVQTCALPILIRLTGAKIDGIVEKKKETVLFIRILNKKIPSSMWIQ